MLVSSLSLAESAVNTGHDIGHWPDGDFQLSGQFGQQAGILDCPNGPVATVQATGGSGEHWPDAVNVPVYKSCANKRQSPVY